MVSLVVATRSRVRELNRLLTSLEKQTCQDFEVIVVDQNTDDRLAGVVAGHTQLTIHHLRCNPGASRARNVGLTKADGEIVAFPDDDCWYPETLLTRVTNWFAAHRESDGLLGVLHDENNQSTGPRWPTRACLSTQSTIWKWGITPTAFLTRAATETIGSFDERIGPGVASGYHSGEDTDYFLRGIREGLRMWHDPEFIVFHPSFHGEQRLSEKSYLYAKGGGYIFRAYHYPRTLAAQVVIRALGGAAISIARGNTVQARSYAKRAVGFVKGYLCGPTDIAKATGRPGMHETKNARE